MTTCFPLASGVPGLAGAPQWWDNSAGAPRPYDSNLLDPRWRGAFRHGYQNGAGEEAVFRGLHMVEAGNPVLYASLQIFNDPTEGANADGVYIGFQAASGDAYMISVEAYDTLANFDAGNPGGITCYQLEPQPAPGTGYTATVISNPSWVDQTKAWLKIVPTMPQKYNWAVNLRVPTKSAEPDFDDAGINLGALAGGASFKFWYAIVKDMGAVVAAYYWPRTGAEIVIDAMTLENVYPSPSTWDSARTGSGAACGPGISLSSIDIGTTNTDPGTGLPAPHLIKVSTASPQTNHLFARPLNGTGGDVTPNSLKATFRTANWGSAADFSFATGATPWEEVLPGTVKDNGPTTTATGTKASIEFDWTISTTEAADWIPPAGTKWTHQCMLVTLSGPYDFIDDSAYRNMGFVQASRFERMAQLNVQGLKRIPGGGRHRVLYVYVDRSNMPAQLDEPQQPRDVAEALKWLERREDGWDEEAGREEASPHSQFDRLANQVPTVRYHVFHTTGERINVAGRVKPVVREQTAFGYFVQHKGPVYGWDHSLGGDFRKERDGLFRISVPEGGRVTIRTRIRAWEQRPPRARAAEVEKGPPPDSDEEGRPAPAGCLKRLLGAGGLAAARGAVRWVRRFGRP